MPLSRPRRRETPAPQSSQHSKTNSLVAAAEQLSARLALGSATVEQGWQAQAWDAYERVPELRTAARVTGQAMSACRLVIARVSHEGEPAPLDVGTDEEPGPDYNHPAIALLESFAGGAGGQSELLDFLGTALTVPGEGVLVGSLDPDLARLDPRLRMQAYSSSQVILKNKAPALRLGESAVSDWVLPEDAASIRVWRRHPRFSWEADSAARAALPILREIILYDQSIAASALSRLAGAGLLFIPEGMALPGLAEDDSTVDAGDPFMRMLMEVMGTAIRDRDSAAAMVPITIRAEAEDIAAVRHIDFANAFDEKVLELREAAIDRLAVAVDMPAEMLKGLGSGQHWTASLITDQWVSSYLTSLMGLVCGSLTTGWLYPALADKYPDMPADVIIWFDSSSLRTRPNSSAEAQALYDRGAISQDTLRRANGFDEADAPNEEESIQNLLKTLVSSAPSLAPVLLPLLGVEFPEAALDDAAAVVDATEGGSPSAPAASPDTSSPAPGAQEPAITPVPGG